MGVREGLLALLAAGPRHGYRLKLDFEAATGGAWKLNVGQVYGALQKLEGDGHVALDGQDEGRKRYRVTAAGRRRLRTWWTDEPVAHELSARDELTMKVLLAAWAAPSDARAVVRAQRAATTAAIQAHTRRRAALGVDADVRDLVHLDRVILHARAELDWLDRVEERLDDADRRTGRGTADATADATEGDDR